MALTIPQYEDFLSSIGASEANESGARFVGDARLSPGQLAEMQGDPLQAYQKQQLNAQGYIEMPRYTDAQWFNQRYGTNFKSGEDYAKWLYGGGQVEQGPDGQQYFKTPAGVDQYVNRPLEYDAPDSKLGNLVKMGIIGLAGAGLTGMLPGTENVFGGMFPGVDASWGVNAAGSGTAGMSQAELAALIESGTAGTAGAGLEAAGFGGNGLNWLQSGILESGGSLGNDWKKYFDIAGAAGNVLNQGDGGAGVASQIQSGAATAGIGEQGRQFDEIVRLLAPYVDAGEGALDSQLDLLGLNGAERQQLKIAAIQASPKYASTIQQGENMMLQNASASGNLRGGNLQQSLAQFRPAVLNSMINEQFTRLGDTTTAGQNAAGLQANAGLQTGQNVAALLEQQGAATAGGQIAQGNVGRQTFGSALKAGGIIGGYF